MTVPVISTIVMIQSFMNSTSSEIFVFLIIVVTPIVILYQFLAVRNDKERIKLYLNDKMEAKLVSAKYEPLVVMDARHYTVKYLDKNIFDRSIS